MGKTMRYTEFYVDGDKIAGCYVLFMEDVAMYVGRSRNIMHRVGGHLGKDRRASTLSYGDFDRVRLYYCGEDELDLLEAYLIRKFQPKVNVHGMRKRAYTAPIFVDHLPDKAYRRM